MPQLPRHSGDRNRTSPFAFTGNKFEFRAVGSTASIAWPNTVLNTIVAESLDYIGGELEKAAGTNPTSARMQSAVLGVLKKLLKEHKRIRFDGDNYSPEWHKEAGKRGLPNLRDSWRLPDPQVEEDGGFFKKYGVLSKAEVESRHHIAVEKWVKQLTIEAEIMTAMARTLVLPAALRHQTLLAEAVTATEAAGVDCDDTVAALGTFTELVSEARSGLVALEDVSATTSTTR